MTYNEHGELPDIKKHTLVLDNYQEDFISRLGNEVIEKLSVIAQLSTGGGKTVIFSSICDRYIKKQDKDVIIFVHKTELLDQTRKTLWNWYGILSQKIDASTKNLEQVRVFVAMVETFNNRSKNSKFLDYMKNVGLVIIDEAHLSNFKKIFCHFGSATRIGFTATPLAATKKDPLINYYSSIVTGPSIRDLIEFNKINPSRGLVRDITYTIKNIDRDQILKKGEDFDDKSMGDAFSNKRQIQNTIDAYIKHANGKKTLCFNANVEHSRLVTMEMQRAGLNARHLDGSSDEGYRRECFLWLKNTPDAILCNVGIATTGFDDPSIECVIINKSTLSFPLWIQMCGRGGRPHRFADGTYKTHFTVLDMGDNVIGGAHGEWSDYIDWEYIFYNPKTPRAGVAPSKVCPACDGVNLASARVCKCLVFSEQSTFNWETMTESNSTECGYEFPFKASEEDSLEREMVLVSKEIDVDKTIKFFDSRGEYYSWYKCIDDLCYHARQKIQHDTLTPEEIESIWIACASVTKEWVRKKGKKNNGWFTARGRVIMVQSLTKHGFEVDVDKMTFILDKGKEAIEHAKKYAHNQND